MGHFGASSQPYGSKSSVIPPVFLGNY